MSRCWSFVTQVGGRRATSGLVVHGCTSTAANALRFYRATLNHTSTTNCAAWGKVAFLDGPLVTVRQVDDHGNAGIAACANALAAVGAVRSQVLFASESSVLVNVPGGMAEVELAVTHRYPPIVYQRWDLSRVEIDVEDHSSSTVLVSRITGLNDYWLTSGCRVDDLPRLLTAVGDPCSTRIAAVDLQGDKPQVTFFTCGGQRRHGGTPLTGLIVLAMAAERIPWLAALGDGVETARGFVSLPTFNAEARTIDLPPVVVEFEGVELSDFITEAVLT